MHLSVTADSSSTTLDYWLNWRILFCSVIVLAPIVIALVIIWKFESLRQVKCEGRESQEDLDGELHDDDVWRPCLEGIHPFWLLGYRVLAFAFALSTVTIKTVVNGFGIFYYYTQWTFTLVTIYFGFGTFLSIYGCYEHQKMRSCDFNVQQDRIDAEQGCYMPLINRKDTNVQRKALNPQEICNDSRAAGISSYLFQVIFQVEYAAFRVLALTESVTLGGSAPCLFTIHRGSFPIQVNNLMMNAGAVVLTDFIYWSIIFPYVPIEDFKLNFFAFLVIAFEPLLCVSMFNIIGIQFQSQPNFRSNHDIVMTVNMHTVNVILLLGDTALNCLPFPWFRISYFILWSGAYTIIQWIIHACVPIWWPYPFLDLSSPKAPLWYFFVAFMHLPCYGLFALIVNAKDYLLSKRFPHSYRCLR